MRCVLFFLGLNVIYFRWNFLGFLMPWAQHFQHLCLNLTPDSPHRALNQAIVCGQNLPKSPDRDLLIRWGLIHLIVVSGAHLHFVEAQWDKWTRTWPRLRRGDLIALFGFCLFCGWQAPIYRALLQRLIHREAVRRRQTPCAFHEQLLSGLLGIGLCPPMASSLSFQMSWLCALALSLPWLENKPFRQCLAIYLLLLIPTTALSPTHPLSILSNWFIAPLVGGPLFHLAFIGLIFHPATVLSDLLWRGLFALLKMWPSPGWWLPANHSLVYLWFYIAFLQLLFWSLLCRWRRYSLVSSLPRD